MTLYGLLLHSFHYGPHPSIVPKNFKSLAAAVPEIRAGPKI